MCVCVCVCVRAPEESCANLTVKHTLVGMPALEIECDATCLIFRKLRLIGSSPLYFCLCGPGICPHGDCISTCHTMLL